MVHLVALLEAAQDGDRVLDRRLADEDRLEPPLERGVLLDVLAVLVERGGADHAQLATGQHRLEHVAGVHGALGGAGADDGVQLVDERDDLALGVGDLLQHRLQPLLELAAVLRAGDHRSEVERDEPRLCFRLSGTSPSTMRRARPSTMAVLPTPGSPISTGLFFVRRDSTWITRRISSSRPMTGSSLPSRAVLGEVAAVLLERLVLLLGVLAGDAVAAAHLAQRREQLLAAHAEAVGQRQQEVLGRQVLVAQLLARGVGRVERLLWSRASQALVAAVRLGQLRRRPRRRALRTDEGREPPASAGRAGRRVLLAEQRGEQVVGRDLGVGCSARGLLEGRR